MANQPQMALTSVTSQELLMRPTPLAALSATTYYQVVVSASVPAVVMM